MHSQFPHVPFTAQPPQHYFSNPFYPWSNADPYFAQSQAQPQPQTGLNHAHPWSPTAGFNRANTSLAPVIGVGVKANIAGASNAGMVDHSRDLVTKSAKRRQPQKCRVHKNDDPDREQCKGFSDRLLCVNRDLVKFAYTAEEREKAKERQMAKRLASLAIVIPPPPAPDA